MQCSRQEVIDVLRRTGFSALADEVPVLLPDPVDIDDAAKVLEPYGVDRDELVNRMGGSP
jgi:hypothetical protein